MDSTVSDAAGARSPDSAAPPLTAPGPSPSAGRTWWGEAWGYLAALILVGAANGLAAYAGPALAGGNLAMLFLVSVLIGAAGFGLGPALLAAVAAAVTYNFFFLEPRLTFRIGHPADILTFSMFFAVAVVTGWLGGRARDHARVVARRNAIIGSLLEASRALSAATTTGEASQALAGQVASASGGAAIVLLPSSEAMRVAGGPAGLTQLAWDHAAAAWRTWETGAAPAPAPGPTPDAGWAFRPLQGLHGRVGVVGMRAPASKSGSEEESLLSALLHQGAVALERANLSLVAAENQGLRRADQLRSALLNSISHDFRTPLSTVLGSATTLLEYEGDLKPAVRRDLLESVREEACRLNRYVGDLLDMSRLEGGALKPRREWTDVRDVLRSALGRLGERLGTRRIERDLASELTLLELDPTLLEQALLNLLDNAAAYSPPGSRIVIAAHEDHANVLIAIEDQGPGIPRESLSTVFDRFRRLEAPGEPTFGLGVGLSIAKGFVEAMGGRIAAASPVDAAGGTRFLISLPKSVATPRGLL